MLVNGNALHIPLKDKSIQCCVTSPPYWGLRDYGTAEWVGGDLECDHAMIPDGGAKQLTNQGASGHVHRNCKCGAIRIDKQLGLEQTPEEYVENMVAVFREVKRVLRDDGTLWLNLGDSYANANPGSGGKCKLEGAGKAMTDARYTNIKRDVSSLKPKDLVGIPWRVAFALQADGWYLRNDIIWHKPNPMPESVTDRCTKSHEYIFLLTKSAKYYYDNEAIKEPVSDISLKRSEYGWDCDRPSTKNASMGGDGIHTEKMGDRFVNPSGRNKRTVWTITTKPYKGAHYATFPPDLIDDCIKAGSAEGDIILDPFVGSGTTCLVARDLGRESVGLDLSLDYLVNNARVRLELDKLEYWYDKAPAVEGNFEGLPMFTE